MQIFKDWFQVLSGMSPDLKVANIDEITTETDDMIAAMRESMQQKIAEKKRYLVARKRDAMTQNFKYTLSAATDVKDTWRNYIDEEIPEMTGLYSFLY